MSTATGFSSNTLGVSNNKIRIAVSLFYFGLGVCFATWASRIPIIKEELQLSEAVLGTILLMLPIGQLLTMPIAGTLVNRLGSHKVLPWAALFYALVLILIAFSTNAWLLGASLFLFGIGSNLCNISVNTQGVLVEELYGKSIMSSFHGAWSLGGFAGSLIGLLTINLQFTTLTHFVIIIFLSGINIFIHKSLLIGEKVEEKEKKKESKMKPDAIIFQLGLIGFFSMAIEGAMFDWSGVYFKEIVHAPVKWATLGFSSFMVMMATGRFIGDAVISKIGRKRTLQISGFLMFIGMLTSVIFPNIYVCTFAFMLVGLGVACCVPTVYSLTGKHHSIPAGVALAMVSSISFLGFLIGPVIIGYIAELFNLQYSFAVYSIFGLLMLIMTSKLRIFKDQ